VLDANGSRLRLGAALPFAEFEDSDAVLRYAPALAQAVSEVGSPQIRSTATIGGNIVTASAAGDSLPALVAHDAILVLESARGRRELSVAGFLENRPASLGSGEIVTEICVPKKDNILMAAFAKLGRRNALAIARISAALVVTQNREGRTEARLVLGAVAAAPLRVPEAERLIEAEGPVRDLWLTIAEAASAAVVRSIPGRPSAPYKTQAAKGLVLDVLEKAGCS
jgi:carbon-monoxide dehydrogenase medium subunit